MKKFTLVIAILLANFSGLFAQSLPKIGPNGIVVPLFTETNRLAISSPETGLIVYQTDATVGFYSYNGSSWERLMSGSTDYLPLTGGTLTGGLSGTTASFSGNLTASGELTTIGSATGASTDTRFYVKGGRESEGIKFEFPGGTYNNVLSLNWYNSAWKLRTERSSGEITDLSFARFDGSTDTEYMKLSQSGNLSVTGSISGNGANLTAGLSGTTASFSGNLIASGELTTIGSAAGASTDTRFYVKGGRESEGIKFDFPGGTYNNVLSLNWYSTAWKLRTERSGGDITDLSFARFDGTTDTEYMKLSQSGNLSVTGTMTSGGAITGTSLVKSGGTSSEFLKADGSVDANTYLQSSDVSSTYLPLSGGTLTGGLSGTSSIFSGNTTIGGELSLNSQEANRRIILWDGGNENEFYGLGLNSHVLRFQVDGTGSNHIFYAATSSTTSNELFRINGSGGATTSGTINAASFVKSGGTSSEFLKADGSVDANTYLSSTDVSSTYLPLSGGTLTGLLSNTNNEFFRVKNSSGYLTGFNDDQSIRTGYLQFNSGSNIKLIAEELNNLILGSASQNTLILNADQSADFNGAVRIPASLTVSNSASISGDATIGGSTTSTGLITALNNEAVRMKGNTSFISGYNSDASIRTGYLQFNSGSDVKLIAEELNTLILGSAHQNTLTLNADQSADFNGAVRIPASLTVSTSASISGDATIGGSTTSTGLITALASEAMRMKSNSSLISGYNSDASIRTGYLQFNSGSDVKLIAEELNILVLGAAHQNTLTLNADQSATFGGVVNATSYVKTGGTSSQFLKADGSVDANTYLQASDISSSYLALSGGTLTGGLNGTSATFSGDATINTLTVGLGNSSISTNSAIGYHALNSNTTGDINTAVGYSSLESNTDGFYNTALGTNTLKLNTGGARNTAIGGQALYNNNGNDNTALGYLGLLNNTSGSFNVGIGSQSLFSNTSGGYNTASGSLALQSNLTGSNNTASGYLALSSNTTGGGNTAAGSSALPSNTSGTYNVAIGVQSLEQNTTGDQNTAIGTAAIDRNTTGSGNAVLGAFAGRYISDGSTFNTIINNSILIGSNTKPNADNESNQIVIGYNSTGIGSNTTVIGNSSTTAAAIYGDLLLGSTTDLGTYQLQVTGNSIFTGTLKVGDITIPNTDGNSGEAITTDGSGNLSWSSILVRELADEATAAGGQINFTLTQSPSANSKLKMYVNGIRISNSAYSVSGTTVTYVPASNGGYALTAGDRIQFDYYY